MFGISAFAETPFSALNQTLVSTSLTGVVADAAVGTVFRGVTSFALSRVEASSFVGTIVFDQGPELSGNVAAGLVGIVVPSTIIALTGVTASGLVNTAGFQRNFALTGVFASGGVGTVVAQKTFGLTGVQASGNVGNVSSVYWILVATS